ncbi:MAG: ATPase domain-containing protein [Nitrososphaerales archaeon]
MSLTIGALAKALPALAPGTVTAFIGHPCTGKSTLCMEIILEKIDKIPVVFFVLDRPIHTVKKIILSRNEKAERMLKIIDGYSCLSGGTGAKSDRLFVIDNLSNPSDINVTINSVIAQTGRKALFILDSFSTILNYMNEDLAARLLNSIVARLRENDYWGFIVFEGGIHSEQFYNKIKHIMDCVVEFKVKEDEKDGMQLLTRYFRVFVYRYGEYNVNWHPLIQSKVMKI